MTESRQSPSMEDYLRTIASLSRCISAVSVTEIGKHRQVKAPSVSEALNRLEKAGLIRRSRYGKVELTEQGAEVARLIDQRHALLLRFLQDILKVPPDIAEKDACGMEHALSSVSQERLSRLVETLSIR